MYLRLRLAMPDEMRADAVTILSARVVVKRQTPDRKRRNRLAHQARNVAWWQAHKAGMSCAVCGDGRPDVLDYHHKSRGHKRAAVARLVYDGYSLDAIQAEIAKCSCLCASCHRIFTAAERRGHAGN